MIDKLYYQWTNEDGAKIEVETGFKTNTVWIDIARSNFEDVGHGIHVPKDQLDRLISALQKARAEME